MNLNFILEKEILACFILHKKMHNEEESITNIKSKLYNSNDLGYKILIGEVIPNLDEKEQKEYENLFNELMSTKIFENIYSEYSSYSKEEVALYILRCVIYSDDLEVDKLRDELWEKYNNAYKRLMTDYSNNPIVLLKDNNVVKTVNEFIKTPEFNKLYEETITYSNYLKELFENNKDMLNQYLQRVLKMDFNLAVNVYISHPNAYTGYAFDDDKIAWGHFKGVDNPNYNIVYLTHEFLHCLIPYEKDKDEMHHEINHCIVELTADYELWSLLNKKSTINEGHEELKKYKKFIYPYWLKYIGLDEEDLKLRLQRDNININDIPIIIDDLSKLNIKEFIDYCYEQYMKKSNDKTR